MSVVTFCRPKTAFYGACKVIWHTKSMININ